MTNTTAFTTVLNLDHYGSLWGDSPLQAAEWEIAKDRAEGAVIDEWETSDRDGQPLRVVRVTHPQWGVDIRVFTTEARTAVAA